VAEHAIALLMSVNRRITQASIKVKMGDFTLDSSLLGRDIHGKNVGIMGTGKIGQILCRIITGFGANLLAYDVFEADAVKEMGGKYVSQEEIYKTCDVIFLMMPLLPATKHTINEKVLPLLKKGVILINTSRGGLIDTSALVTGLQSGIIGGCGLDVYENEGDYFFQDWSGDAIEDPMLVSLMGNNKVVMTAHQAFFTREAIDKIVSTTIENLSNYSSGLRGEELPNLIC
jgi:D-lactate dehydrogenase